MAVRKPKAGWRREKGRTPQAKVRDLKEAGR